MEEPEPTDQDKEEMEKLFDAYQALVKTESEYVLSPEIVKTIKFTLPNMINVDRPTFDEATGLYAEDWFCGIETITEDCHAGSLTDLIGQHSAENRKVPTLFIWLVVRALSEALHNLQTGELYGEDTNIEEPHVVQDWKKVLHKNITPATILLRPVADGKYPVPVLASFENMILYEGSLGHEPEGCPTFGYLCPVRSLRFQACNVWETCRI